jgi:parallel beta-helix repeat protein
VLVDYSNSNIISSNIVSANTGDCIQLDYSISNIISNNTVSGNSGCSLMLVDYSNSNIISNNLISDNTGDCIGLDYSSSNTIANNILSGNYGCSLMLDDYSNSNIIANNILSGNDGCCIVLDLSSNNKIYLNNFMNNRENVRSSDSTNIWESPSKITYSYKGSTYTNYLGNYWNDYTGSDADNDGIGDTPYSIDSDKDNYPLMQPLENYSELQEEKIFDTDPPANPYPSIPGTHTGTITPNQDITLQKLYTYPCEGTGGHTESVRISGNRIDKSASWNGYAEDRDTITFDSSFTLESGKTYNYVIKTGSYPQIHHKKALQTETGWLNCTKFTDANGKEYDDWIPAIQLFG